MKETQAVFTKTWERLEEYLQESHRDEMKDQHGGDATHNGPAPEACSYCEVIRESQQLTRLAAVLPQKEIECRGRNGYFWMAEASVYTTINSQDAPIVRIGLSSKTGYRDAPPVMIEGSHDSIERLLLHLLFQVGRERRNMHPDVFPDRPDEVKQREHRAQLKQLKQKGA